MLVSKRAIGRPLVESTARVPRPRVVVGKSVKEAADTEEHTGQKGHPSATSKLSIRIV